MCLVFGMQEAPFFTEKLQTRVLPCVICFLDGIAMDRLVGFDQFDNRWMRPVFALVHI